MKTPQGITEMMQGSNNRRFLRHLYRLPATATRVSRVKALNTGSKKQRCLLIHVLHQVLTGVIPVPPHHKKAFLATSPQKAKHLNKHFITDDAVRRLLNQTDREQRDILADVNNYHILLYNIFHVRRRS
jgi:hypothetical protein